MKPAIAKGFSSCFWPFVIALHDIGSANYDLASLTAANLFVVIVKAFHLDPEDGLSDRSGLRRLLEMIETCERRGFRQAIAFEHANVELLFERLHYFHRHRSAARCTDLHVLCDSRDIVAGFFNKFQ